MRVRDTLIAAALLCAGQAKAQEGEVQTRGVAQFRRGMEAVRPCERFIDVSSRYFRCTQDATWGTNTTGNTSVPLAYSMGVDHEKFLHEARNNDYIALITATLINDNLKKAKGTTVTTYCNYFKVDCQEFSKYWAIITARNPRSFTVWTRVN